MIISYLTTNVDSSTPEIEHVVISLIAVAFVISCIIIVPAVI